MVGALAIGALAIALAGCAEPGIVRLIDGREVEGRYIPYEAYALYGEAAEEAASGEPARARAALIEAASADPSSPEIWTKIGALFCQAPPGDVAQGEQALQRAEALDPEYAPLFQERARCGLLAAERAATPEARRAKLEPALAAAERAMALDPDDIPTHSLRAELLYRAGREGDARWLLLALAVRRPSSTEALSALYDFGKKHGDEALVLRALRRLGELGTPAPADASARPPLADIDLALGRDDLRAAQRLAHKARLPLSELAVRAAALGRVGPARSQAEILVGADPNDTSARIALAVAADLAGDPAALTSAMTGLSAAPGQGQEKGASSRTREALSTPSPLARLLFAELLARRVSPEAARVFLGPGDSRGRSEAEESSRASGDELRVRIERRVLRAIATAPGASAAMGP